MHDDGLPVRLCCGSHCGLLAKAFGRNAEGDDMLRFSMYITPFLVDAQGCGEVVLLELRDEN